MSTYQQPTADEQLQAQIGVRKSVKRTKSKNNKSKSKKKPNKQDSQNNRSDPDIDFDKNELNHKATRDNSKGNSTLTKPTTHTDRKQHTQRQVKLNFYINKKSKTDSTSIAGSTKYAMSEYERKKSSLEKELSEKEAFIEKLKSQKQVNLHKFTKLKIDAEQQKINSKKILQQQLRLSAQAKREQKAEIYPKFGYYKQASWTTFIQGEYIIQAKKTLQSLQKRILQLQSKRKNSRQDQRERLTFQIDYLLKEKNQALVNLKSRENQLIVYKERLRLADKEANCMLAKTAWPLIHERYLPLELLGSGGFGEVYKCYDLQKNNHVAIKINCFEPTKSQENINQFIKHVQRQVVTLKTLNHPNIVKLIDQITIDNKISFVLQYCSGPQLSKYLSKRSNLEEKQARGIIRQLSFALRYMFQQKNRIIHYDLKPANIIFHYGCVKILDFGLCKKMESEDTKIDLTSQGVGTYWYLPPETFKDYAQISCKVDVWSLGVIFYQLLYGKRPFGHGINQNKIYQQGIILKALKVEFSPDKKFKVSDQAKDFIRSCLKYDPEQRLDPDEVYNHPYLNQ